MKKFVVTGGSGFIGSNLVKFLLKKNYFVINIDKLGYSANPYNLRKISKTGVNRISVGSITHSAKYFDFSLNLSK